MLIFFKFNDVFLIELIGIGVSSGISSDNDDDKSTSIQDFNMLLIVSILLLGVISVIFIMIIRKKRK